MTGPQPPQAAAGIRPDSIGLAVAAMVGTDLTLSIADALIKATLGAMPLAQLVFLRSCITLPLLLVVIRWSWPRLSLRPRLPGWAVLRSALLLASLLCYYASLPLLDLSLAAAVYYTIPLFIALFAALFTGERVGAKGWIGVTLGFAGVLLMLRPDTGGLEPAVLLPLVSAILYALGMVVTRTRARGENPFVLALVFNLLALALGGAAGLAATGGATLVPGPLAGDWIALAAKDWALIVLLSGTMLVGSVGTAFAYQSAPPAIVSTWDFSYLAFAVLWGVIFFGERLDALAVTGICLIAAAGVIVIRR